MRYEKETGAFRGFAFVSFVEIESAEKILAEPPGNIKFEGRTLNIQRDGDPPPGKGREKGAPKKEVGATVAPVDGNHPEKLYVRNLAPTSTRESVVAHFSQFGSVIDFEFKFDEQANFAGGGYITFADPAVAQNVLQNHATSYCNKGDAGRG